MLLRNITCLYVIDCLCVASLCFMLLFPSLPAIGADRAGDEFLTGYMAYTLERGLHWERDSYILKIVNGVATVTLFKDDPVRRKAADKQLRTICGFQGIAIVVQSVDGGKSGAVSRFMELTGEAETFPKGALFTQFNMDTSAYDLINVDYTIGIPVTYRYGDNSPGVRIYDQGSHSGDEFLQRVNPPEPFSLSYEAIRISF